MHKIVTLLSLLTFLASCNKPSGNLVIDPDLVVSDQLIKCTVSGKDFTEDFEFTECSGSLTTSGIIIRHQSEFDLSGIYLITRIHNDSVNFWLESKVGHYGDSRKFHLEDSLLIVNK